MKIFLAIFALVLILCPAVRAGSDSDFEMALRLGDAASFYKKADKAIEYFQFAAEQKPKEAEPHVRLGQQFYEMGRYEQAKAEFKRASNLKMAASTREFLKAALQEMDVYETLFKEIEKTKDPKKKLYLHLKVGESMTKTGKFYMALAGPHFESVLETQADNVDLVRFLAEGYFNSSNSRKAEVYYKKLNQLAPRSVSFHERLAECSLSNGDTDTARKSYKRALREAIREGALPVKKAEIKKLIQSLPERSDQTEFLIEEKRFDEALSILRQTLALNPGDVSTMTRMGRVVEEMGQEGQAERLYQEALRLQPENPAPHYYWARFLLLKKKKYEDAIDEFKFFQDCVSEQLYPLEDAKMIESEKKNLVETSRYIAYIYLEILQQPAEAIQELESLKPDEIKSADVFYDLGIAYLRAKKRSSAFTCFKKVIVLDPKSEQAKEAENAIDFIHKHSDDGMRYTGPYDN